MYRHLSVFDFHVDSWCNELGKFTFRTFYSHITRVNRNCHT